MFILAALNLRGIREAGTAFAIPTYAFMVAIILTVVWGLIRIFVLGDTLRAPSAGLDVPPERSLAGLALRVPDGADVLVRLRRADRGRGDLQRGAGVPAAQEQERGDHAAAAGPLAITMLVGIVVLARLTHLQIVDAEHTLPPGYRQQPVIPQLAQCRCSAASSRCSTWWSPPPR